MTRARVIAFLFVALAGLAGLASRYVGLPPWWAKYLGVALWATLAYAVVVLIAPRSRLWRTAAIAWGISWAVEFAQMTPGPAYLSSKHLILRLIFGTTFSVWDLPAYVAGVGLGVLIHRYVLIGALGFPE